MVSYNPKKPGRPSHSCHTCLIAGLRRVMGVDVKAGNEHPGSHTLPGLLRLLDELPAHHKPKRVRGDCGFGLDGIMRARAERLFRVSAHLSYLLWQRCPFHLYASLAYVMKPARSRATTPDR